MTIDLQTLKCGECGSSALKRPSWGGAWPPDWWPQDPAIE